MNVVGVIMWLDVLARQDTEAEPGILFGSAKKL